MPRSKNPDNYAPELKQLLELTLRQTAEVRIKMPDYAASERMRNQLYAYINAVDKKETDNSVMYEMALAPTWRQISIRTDGASDDKCDSFLVLTKKSNSAEMRAIASVLAGLEQQAVQQAVQEPYEAPQVQEPERLDLSTMFSKDIS